ncbi:LamG-like jellyroll fold domain-containing protein [Belliella marina]|uniref:LamG-like jellyroll fold domain-containing protein n=1 Tax=Belliella marina TaxID=1644146 RepID=A0ABW4VPX5_9BACT
MEMNYYDTRIKKPKGLIPLVLCMLMVFLALNPESSFAQQDRTLSFPGAEGFGRFSPGGRHGSVYIVTNLNDSGPGSFRDAVSQPNRIIVFEVGGIIRLRSRVVVARNITIASQTAPGDGIVLYGDGLTFTQASNTIVRYLRVRMGRVGTSGADAITMTDNARHLIFDHVSASWGRDENFSITGRADSITIQNCIIAQGLETHSCGGLVEPSGAVSLYRNLYIDNNTRNPKVKGINQFVNNVVYNWGRGGGYIMGGSAGDSYVNIINNYFINGPSTTIRAFSRGTPTFVPYVEGNYHDDNLNGVLDGILLPQSSYDGITTFRETPYDYPMPAQLLSPEETVEYIKLHAGSTYPRRDPTDNYLIDELSSYGTKGKLIANETELPFGVVGDVFGAPAPVDTDRDGIPDYWEIANGLDPNDPSDAMIIGTDGYANIEHYINGLVDMPAPDFLKPISQVQINDLTPVSMDFSWKINDPREAAIVVEYSTDGTVFHVADTLPHNSLQYKLEDLQPDTQYHIRLRTFNESMESAPSVPVTGRTVPVPTAPRRPSVVFPLDEGIYADTTGLVLRWNGSENTEEYILYFGEDPENLQLLDSLTAKELQAPELASERQYYWMVVAANDLGSTESDVWSFTTRPYIPQGLVGAWLMDHDSGTLVADSTDYANHGELNDLDDYSWVEGQRNNAIDFGNGEVTSHILIPHADHLYFDTHSFTISMWMKASEQTTQAYMIHKGTFVKSEITGGTGQWYGIEIKNGAMRFAVDDDITKSELSVPMTQFLTGEWEHVVAVRDTDTKMLKLYRNAKLVGQTADNTKLSIGQLESIVLGNTKNLDTPFLGVMDEVKLYNFGLDENEIMELFHTSPEPIKPYEPSLPNNSLLEGYSNEQELAWKGGVNTTTYQIYLGKSPEDLQLFKEQPVGESMVTISSLEARTDYFWRVDAVGPEGVTEGDIWNFRAVTPKGLVGYWKFDETEGVIAHDASRYGHDAEAVGFPNPVWQAGRFDNAFKFEDPTSTASVLIPHDEHLMFDRTSFTVSMWVKIPTNTYTSSNGRDCYLIHKGSFEAATGKWYGLQLKDGILTFAIDDGFIKTDASIRVTNNNAFNLFGNEWKHIVAVKHEEEKKIKLYINGELAAEKNYTTQTIGKPDPITLGNSRENKPFRDVMDDVRLYNYALTQQEIATLGEGELLFGKANNPYPANLADPVSTSELVLSWEGNAPSYLVYWGLSEESMTPIAADLMVSELLAPALQKGTTYYWRVDATDGADFQLGDLWSFTTSPDLEVRYKNGSNQPTDNQIRPQLELLNHGGADIPYQDLEIRYWLTPENYSGINTWIDHADLGTSHVTMEYQELDLPRSGAFGYVVFTFSQLAGNLDAESNSGIIQSRLANTDWSNMDETDDYSYMASNSFTVNEKITLYYKDQLVWGIEPDLIPVSKALKVLSANKAKKTNGNTIQMDLRIANTGNVPVGYENLTLRYWFTKDTEAQLNFWLDYAALGNQAIQGNFEQLELAIPGADTYLELSIDSDEGVLYPASHTGDIRIRVTKSDWSSFDQSDDHSFQHSLVLQDHEKITLYEQGQLIYGQEPDGLQLSRVAEEIKQIQVDGTEKPEGILAGDAMSLVLLYPNPTSDILNIKLSSLSEEGGAVKIYNAQGLTLLEKALTGTSTEINLRGIPAGIYMVMITNGVNRQVQKVIIH